MTGTRLRTRPGKPSGRPTDAEPRLRSGHAGDAGASGHPGRAGRPGRSGRLGLVVSTLFLVAGGLLLAAGALLVQTTRAPAATQRTVVITMHHTHFEPALVEVKPGTTVRFVLHNTDPIDHEFIVGDAAVHRRHRVGHDEHHYGDVPGEISVPAGTEASTTFRFDRPGRVAYICHLPGHEAYGMVGTVEVG
jgi:uncharacterized cupredoxin-like copper-binding protein